MKSTIQEHNIEYQELKAEGLAIKEIAEHRAMDATKLKAELQDILEENRALIDERRNLETQVSVAKDEKRKLLSQIDNANADADELSYRNNELEKVIKEIDYEKVRIEKANDQLQATIDGLHAELHTKQDNLRVAETQVADSQKAIMSLEADIQDLERANERLRADFVQAQRAHQQEVNKGLELTAKLNTLENTLRYNDILFLYCVDQEKSNWLI